MFRLCLTRKLLYKGNDESKYEVSCYDSNEKVTFILIRNLLWQLLLAIKSLMSGPVYDTVESV